MSNDFYDQAQDGDTEASAPARPKSAQHKKSGIPFPFKVLGAILAVAAAGSLIDPRLAKAPTAHPAQAVHAPTAIVRTF